MKRKILWIILGEVMFFAALGLTLYPVISNYVNKRYASEIYTAYREAIAQTDDTILEQERGRAVAYNQALISGNGFAQDALQSASESYDSILNLAGDGIMGYVEIPKISVRLPIYHGTGDSVLRKGVGHLLGSSLPIGGRSTHSILSGHSGMASQTMFTDLEQLEIGDVFYLRVLGDVLAYQVFEINTVLPPDTSLLGIWEGQDNCTLVTCTPFGVNTHRLLVRGHRIPYTPENTDNPTIELAETVESVDSTWEQEYEKGVYLAIGIVALICLILFIVWLTQKGESNAA